MGGQSGWVILFVLAVLLIIVGIQGNLGVILAIVFCPKYVDIGTQATKDTGTL